MSKKLISAEVVMKMMDLPIDTLKQVMASTGSRIQGSFMDDGSNDVLVITGATFRGMMANGTFVYHLDGHTVGGSKLPSQELKVCAEFNPFLVKTITPGPSLYTGRVIGDCIVHRR